MNRFAALGLLAEAMDGKQLAVLVRHATSVETAMDEVLHAAAAFVGPEESVDDLALSIRRAAGDYQIRTLGGGVVRFVHCTPAAVSRFRGIRLDAVLFEPGVASVLEPSALVELAARGTDVWRSRLALQPRRGGRLMIGRWLARHRDRAALRWHCARRAAILDARPVDGDPDVARARRRLTRWDAALDLWTSNGTP